LEGEKGRKCDGHVIVNFIGHWVIKSLVNKEMGRRGDEGDGEKCIKTLNQRSAKLRVSSESKIGEANSPG